MLIFDVHSHSVKNNALYNPFSLTEIETNFEYISLGIHPWKIKDINIEESFALLNQLILEHQSKLLAIGECGLDKTIDAPLETQIDIFKKHIALSEKLKKPLIIHCVKAFNEIIELKKEINPTQKWIIHDFRKNANIAKQLTQHGIYLSLSPSIFKVKPEILTQYPLEYILLETDDTSFDVNEVFSYFASAKNIVPNDLKTIINKNTNKLFNLNYGN